MGRRKKREEHESHEEHFGLKVGLLFHRMFALFLCLSYTFDLYEKPSFYFLNYGPFIAFKHNSY